MEEGATGDCSSLNFSADRSPRPASRSPPRSSAPQPPSPRVSTSCFAHASAARGSPPPAAALPSLWPQGRREREAPTEHSGVSTTSESAGRSPMSREEMDCTYTGDGDRREAPATSFLSRSGGERRRSPSRRRFPSSCPVEEQPVSSSLSSSGCRPFVASLKSSFLSQCSSPSFLPRVQFPPGVPSSAGGDDTDEADRPSSPSPLLATAGKRHPPGVRTPRPAAAWCRLLLSILISLVSWQRLSSPFFLRCRLPVKGASQLWKSRARSLLMLFVFAVFSPPLSDRLFSGALPAQASSSSVFPSPSSLPRSLSNDAADVGREIPDTRGAAMRDETQVAKEDIFPPASGVVPAPGMKASDLQKTTPAVDLLGLPVKEKVFRARLYGSMFSYAYYFLDILVGTPPQRASVILDTGSSLLAFPCAGCSECGEHLDPAMDTSRSATGEWIDCKEEERCFGTCSGGTPLGGLGGGGVSSMRRCMYTQTYSEGSAIRGIYFSDVVALGEVEQKNPPVRYDFVGCHTQETNLFVTQKAAGIFGISFPKGHRQPTLLDVMFGHANLVAQKMFSVCISEDGGLLTVGGYEPTLLVAPPMDQSTPAVHAWRPAASEAESVSAREIADEGTSPHHASLLTWTSIISHSTYRVPLSGMEVEGLVLGNGVDDFGNTMVDSGTTYSYFPPAVFARWRSFLSRFCTPELFCERERDGRPCWRVSPGTELSSIFPPIKVSFGDDQNSQVWWWPEGYLYRRTGGYFCDGLDDNKVGASVLGLSFFKNKQVLFDREHDRVGFAAAKCPSFFLDQRPRGPDSDDGSKGRPTAPFTVAPFPVLVPMDRGSVPGGAKQSDGLPFSPRQIWVAALLVVVAILVAVTVILLHTIKRSSTGTAVAPAPSSVPSLPFAPASKSAGRFVRGLGQGALGVSNQVYVQRTQRYREVEEAQPHTADAYYDVEEDRFTGVDGDFFVDDTALSSVEREATAALPPLSLQGHDESAFSASQPTLLDLPLGGEEDEHVGAACSP